MPHVPPSLLQPSAQLHNTNDQFTAKSQITPLYCAIMANPTGAHIIARSLRDLGVSVIFGIVGIPVVEIAEEAINLGIRFIGFRNEQAASYAASAYGYLTGRPGVCLVVGGPGVLHAIAGVCTLLGPW